MVSYHFAIRTLGVKSTKAEGALEPSNTSLAAAMKVWAGRGQQSEGSLPRG